jgi:hypothetical protein
MVHQKLFAVGVLGWVMAGCAVQAEGTSEGELSDVKPEDGAEFAANQFGSAQQGHALHYTDWSNAWEDTGYPMGTDNPYCKDWYMYDRWVQNRPAVGWSNYSTWDTSHNWATGPVIDAWMNTLPASYTSGYKHILVDHNTVVARANGRGCSGRYVFQMDNHTNYDFAANRYWFSATLPYWLMPRTKVACDARQATDVPSILVDVYACEAYDARSVAGSIGTFCSKTRGNWRKVGSAQGWGWWNSSSQQCDIATGVYYAPPSGKIGVSFNMVIKAGIGHGVAPADIQIYRYN